MSPAELLCDPAWGKYLMAVIFAIGLVAGCVIGSVGMFLVSEKLDKTPLP